MTGITRSGRGQDRRQTGASGEDRAVAWLERQGWRVLARNWRCRTGEIDVIAQDPGGTLVVCEVKTRRGLGFGHPLEAIDYRKVLRLRRLTGEWLLSQGTPWQRVRIDAIGVLLAADGTAGFTRVTVGER